MLETILLLVVVLGLLIFVHELGHFIMARRTGMGVEEFGFGYPPRLFGVQKNASGKWKFIFGKRPNNDNPNTIYSINWIPFGGFVRIKGEQGDKPDEADSFSRKKIWKRAVVLSAGVSMNIVLAFALISIGFMLGLPTALDQELPQQARIKKTYVQIAEVQAASPAAAANLEVGDILSSVEGVDITSVRLFQTIVEPRLEQPTVISVKRGDETIETSLVPVALTDDGKGKAGVGLVETGIVSYPWYIAIWEGAKTTVNVTWRIIAAFYGLLKNLIITQQLSADVAGPVGIAVLTGQVAKMGFIYVLQFTALLSINLAILNFIPFPALDGGRVLFLIIEKIKGKPVNRRIEGWIHSVGFFMLIGFLLFVTFRDVSRFSESIKGFLDNLF